MSEICSLYLVDGTEASRSAAMAMFGQIYDVEAFASGPACIERLAARVPDIFLIDVDAPATEGYALCRHVRACPASSQVPIIFASAQADLAAHLAGYDAGGDDFIVTPYVFAELQKKVAVLRRGSDEKSMLQNRLDESELLTGLILSNLDEYAVLIKFLRSLNSCGTYRDIAEAIQQMLVAYRLDGALQFRLPGFEITLNRAGEVRPIEASIIEQVRSLGRIAEFHRRAAFNFERVSIRVHDMPLDDPERCGRLRDHLAVAVETVDAKLQALLTHQDHAITQYEIAAMLHDLETALHGFSEKYEKARYRGSESARMLQTNLDALLANLGMREAQEDSLRELVQSGADDLIGIFDFSSETEKTLNALSARLGRILARGEQNPRA